MRLGAVPWHEGILSPNETGVRQLTYAIIGTIFS
jgi:hypothetical protein